MPCCIISSPLGPLTCIEEAEHLTVLAFGALIPPEETGDSLLLRETRAQLAAYFAGQLRQFRLPLAPAGTPFQKQVWAALLEIPYGETCSYGQLAQMAGNPRAARAVGMANHRNPIAIIVPCHRCIGGDGGLTGYGAGLEKKVYLLTLERRVTGQKPRPQWDSKKF